MLLPEAPLFQQAPVWSSNSVKELQRHAFADLMWALTFDSEAFSVQGQAA